MIEGETGTAFNDISTEELQAEIDKRKEEERKVSLPKPILAPDIKPLQAICQKYIEDLSKNGWVNSDAEHYIFDTAMITIFGTRIVDFINSWECGLD